MRVWVVINFFLAVIVIYSNTLFLLHICLTLNYHALNLNFIYYFTCYHDGMFKTKFPFKNTTVLSELPAPSLCSSNRNPSSKEGSHAHGTGLDLNLWPLKCMWRVNDAEGACPESSSASWSMKALPPWIWRYRYLRDGSMLAETKTKRKKFKRIYNALLQNLTCLSLSLSLKQCGEIVMVFVWKWNNKESNCQVSLSLSWCVSYTLFCLCIHVHYAVVRQISMLFRQ